MSSQKAPGEELEGDITFIATPAPAPQKFGTGVDCGVEVTNVSTTPPSERAPLSSLHRVDRHQLTAVSLKLTLAEGSCHRQCPSAG